MIVVQKLKNQLVILINVELPYNLNLPRKTGFYFTDITIPISFFTIEAGRSDMIYFIIIANSEFEDHMMCAKRIREGNYSLVTLKTML